MRISDWSSDVCSSDLFIAYRVGLRRHVLGEQRRAQLDLVTDRRERARRPAPAISTIHRAATRAKALTSRKSPFEADPGGQDVGGAHTHRALAHNPLDRKSKRLNSSH